MPGGTGGMIFLTEEQKDKRIKPLTGCDRSGFTFSCNNLQLYFLGHTPLKDSISNLNV